MTEDDVRRIVREEIAARENERAAEFLGCWQKMLQEYGPPVSRAANRGISLEDTE